MSPRRALESGSVSRPLSDLLALEIKAAIRILLYTRRKRPVGGRCFGGSPSLSRLSAEEDGSRVLLSTTGARKCICLTGDPPLRGEEGCDVFPLVSCRCVVPSLSSCLEESHETISSGTDRSEIT